MANFELAIQVVLTHEGGYVNDPNDPGGETKYGLSKRRYPSVTIKDLTIEEAKALYRRDWWDAYQCGKIADQAVATKVFDMAVNMGAYRALQLLQRAVNYLLPRQEEIQVDGEIGPNTLSAVNRVDPRLLVLALRVYHASWYVQLVEGPDLRFEKFSAGWLKRALA